MDGKRAEPLAGRRVVFLGVCTCRAGPMCPAAGYAFFGGARGPRPTGQVRYPPVGDGVPTFRQRGSAALLGPLWEGAVGAADWGREKRGASLPPSALRAVWADRVPGGGARGPRPTGQYVEPRETGRRGRRPLRNVGNGRTTLSARVHSPRCIFSSVSRRMAARSSVR